MITLTEEERVRVECIRQEKAERDWINAMNYATEQGKKRGMQQERENTLKLIAKMSENGDTEYIARLIEPEVFEKMTAKYGMEAEEICFAPEHLATLIELVDAGTINGSVAKEVFEEMFQSDIDPEKYVEEKGLKVVNDEGALRETIEKVITDNPQSVEDYHNGKKKAMGFLVGQTMKAMKGKANPAMVNAILHELLV